MRGKPLCSRPPTAENRITPADAGKTAPATATTATTGDHPRGCGENLTDRKHAAERLGSPPRMRGKRVGRHFCKFRHGITPADAGKTVNPSSRRGMKWDHPRGCGENYRMRNGLSLERGSPPRMRGKRAQSRRNIGVRRITPADAGKTIELLNALNTTGDHPRGCGENFRTATARSTHAGSPPRMRGKLDDIPAKQRERRITPADAGKTYHRSL